MRILIFVGAALIVGGCGSLSGIPASVGAMPVYERETYDGLQQEIYRIDDDRYITLEGYEDCKMRGVMRWHDKRKNLDVVIGDNEASTSGFWRGLYSIEPGAQRFAVATYGCGDRGCNLWIKFTNDGGETWGAFPSVRYSAIGRNFNGSLPQIEATDVRVTREGLIYVIPEHREFYYRYRIDGTRAEWMASESASEQEAGAYDWKDLASVPQIRTPSGQDRFHCDASLNPKPHEE